MSARNDLPSPLEVIQASAVLYVTIFVYLLCSILSKKILALEEEHEQAVTKFLSFVPKLFEKAVIYSFDVAIETLGGILRAFVFAVTFWRLALVCCACAFVGLAATQYHKEIIVAVDAAYGVAQPIVFQSIKDFLNYVRVVYSVFIGVWNSLALLLRIPRRVFAKVGIDCGFTAANLFIKASIALGDALYALGVAFATWTTSVFRDDLNVSAAAKIAREFTAELVDAIECGCGDKSFRDGVRAFLHPLHDAATDEVVGGVVNFIGRLLTLPFWIPEKLSLGPIIDPVQATIEVAAQLLNRYGEAVLQWYQTEVDVSLRVHLPPLFSVFHRLAAVCIEMFRTVTEIVFNVDHIVVDCMGEEARLALNPRNITRQAIALSEVFFVDCVGALGSFILPIATSFHRQTSFGVKALELGYNFTVDFLAGPDRGVVQTASFDHGALYPSGGGAGCTIDIGDDLKPPKMLDRAYGTFAVATWRFSTEVMPYGISACSRVAPNQFQTTMGIASEQYFGSTAGISAQNINRLGQGFSWVVFLLTYYEPLRQLLEEGCLALLRNGEAYAWYGSHVLSKSLLSVPPVPVTTGCLGAFFNPPMPHEDAFIELVPTVVYGMLDPSAVQASGFVKLPCAATQHDNHVYAGSLKMYVFSVSACQAAFPGGRKIRCEYVDPDRCINEAMIPYSEFNTNPICESGDAIAGALRGLLDVRRLRARNIDIAVASFSRCWSDIGVSCAQAGLLDVLQFLESTMDIMVCHVAEAVYRTSAMVGSVLSPSMNFVYDFSSYPDDGYVVLGSDNAFHIQAKPIEAGLITGMTSILSAVVYTTIASQESNKIMIELAEELAVASDVGGTAETVFKIVFDKLKTLRYKIQVVAFRNAVLYARDVLIGILQVSRALATVWNYAEDNTADPSVPHPDFTELQTKAVDFVELVQDIAKLFEETFFEGIDDLVEAGFYLADALYNADGQKMIEFFTFVINKLGGLVEDVAKGLWQIIKTGPLGEIINIVCDIVGVLKSGFCTMVTTEWIPAAMRIRCNPTDPKQCPWWPSSNDGYVSLTGLDVMGNSIRELTEGGQLVTFEMLSAYTSKCPLYALCFFQLPDTRGMIFVNNPNMASLPSNPPGVLYFDYREDENSAWKQYPDENNHLSLTHNPHINPYTFSIAYPFDQSYQYRVKGTYGLPVGYLESAAVQFDSSYKRHLLGGGGSVGNFFTNTIPDTFQDVAETVEDVVQDAIDQVLDFIPSKFDLKMASMVNIISAIDESAGNDLSAECARSFSCNIDNSGIRTALEPSVCDVSSDCDSSAAYCWTPHQEDCPAFDESDEDWASSCGCSQVNQSHCNFASGFCTTGPSPFVKALRTCPVDGIFRTKSEYYYSMCYVTEAWRCSGVESVESEKECLRNLPPLGPRLCRSYCGATIGVKGNHLQQYNYQGTNACVCEIGADRLQFRYNYTQTSMLVTSQSHPESLSNGRRHLLSLPFTDDVTHNVMHNATHNVMRNATHNVMRNVTHNATMKQEILKNGLNGTHMKGMYTMCSRTPDCESRSIGEIRICRSLWGAPVPCYSCSERVHSQDFGSELGYSCEAETKTCVCAAPPDLPFNVSEAVDASEWRGNSWCDRVMRGYHLQIALTPIERASVQRCSILRATGEAVAKTLGVLTIPPDIFYNPSRGIWLAKDVFEGVYTFIAEGWNDKNTTDFFSRLIEKRVDPVLVFKLLSVAQTTFRRSVEIVRTANVSGPLADAVGTISPQAKTALEKAGRSFTRFASNVANHTSAVTFGDVGLLTWQMASLMAPTVRKMHAMHAMKSSSQKPEPVAPNVPFDEHSKTNEPTKTAMTTRRQVLSTLSDDACVPVDELVGTLTGVFEFGREHYGPTGTYRKSMCSFTEYAGLQDPADYECEQLRVNATSNKKKESIFPIIIGEITETSNAFEKATRDDEENDAENPSQRASVERWIVEFFARPNNFLRRFRNAINRKHFTDWTEKRARDVRSLLSCDWETVACTKERKYDVLEVAFAYEALGMTIAFGCSIFGLVGTILGISSFFGWQFGLLPFVSYVVYNVSPLCFPAIPACLADDLFESVDAMTPRFIGWPDYVVKHPSRRVRIYDSFPVIEAFEADDEMTGIVDCGEQGFVNGFDGIEWAIKRFGNGWKMPSVYYDVVPFARGARDRWTMKDAHTKEATFCAIAVSSWGTVCVASASLIFVFAFFQVLVSIALATKRFAFDVVPIFGKLFVSMARRAA